MKTISKTAMRQKAVSNVLASLRMERLQPSPAVVQAMVACAHCGWHLPHSEALAHAGQHYCSPAHRDAGAR